MESVDEETICHCERSEASPFSLLFYHPSFPSFRRRGYGEGQIMKERLFAKGESA